MDKNIIGLLFITAGVMYGSLVFDGIYNVTLGYLIRNKWLEPPAEEKVEKTILGRKSVILLYSLSLIIIGLFILWTKNN
jgi:hypothetical protein